MQIASMISDVHSGSPMAIGEHFFAQGFRANEFDGLMDPFLMVDDFRMRKDTFGPHRHQGISALTYLFPESESAFQNHDSLGNHLVIEPGSLHWFMAGKGAVHHEYPADEASAAHGLQIFVDLPPELKNEAPYALHLKAQDIPEITSDGVRMRVVAGELLGVRSPIRIPQPLCLLDGHLAAGAKIDLPIPDGWHAWLYVMKGALTFDAGTLASGQAAAFQLDRISFTARSSGETHFVLMAGTPQQAGMN